MISWLTVLSALLISMVAIFFSVTGLIAIFAASPISIGVMGTSIELGKLVAVVWLHYNWHNATTWLKAGLTIMLLVIMLITSLGIFGFLSKSHVEQTLQTQESTAQVTRIETEIARHDAIILRSNQKIKSYEDNGSGVDASLNGQIDKEQARIDTAYDRVKPVIQVQLDIIASDATKTEARTKPYQTELTSINQQLVDLQTALSTKEIKTAQGIVGTQPDGSYQEKTQAAIRDFRTRNEKRRNELLTKIDSIRGVPSAAARAAQEEINRIRASAQSEIDDNNASIKTLRGRMGKANATNIETLITDEQNKIKVSNTELNTLTQEKYILEANYRKLEAEIGPIKHIAEFVYDEEADTHLLEKAVRWLIIIIIFVFDPFAVFLLIAAQHSFDRARRERLAHVPEPEMEELLNDYKPGPLSDEDKEWLNMAPAGQEFGSDAFVFEKEPVMPENEDVLEHKVNHNHEWGELPTIEDYFDDDDELEAMAEIDEEREIDIIEALQHLYPELRLDFNTQVKSGSNFPLAEPPGAMFLRTDLVPSRLFIFSGTNWDHIDKNLLNFTAYSHEYIKALIKKVGNGSYKPELLNELEKRNIEELLGRE